ncbi:MAG: PIN domain-containing protein [Acidimicrobiia bacterium]|nr:PIN domain-containing protein [Acidimicrobiia bacterium]
MIVIDASAMVEILLNTEVGRRADAAIGVQEMSAPELLDSEVCSAIARLERAGELTAHRVDAAVADLALAPVDRFPHVPLLSRVRHLWHNISAYDAWYVALAESLGCGLVTIDGRLARAPDVAIEVTLVPR